jgi:energy-coupling factor transport system permease protein
VAAALIAFIVGGWLVPALILGAVLVTASSAGVVRRMLPFLLAALPILISIGLVNTFLYPGAEDVIFSVGPFDATATGLVEASQAALRVVVLAFSVGLFAATTPTSALVDDLERRGLGRRATFVLGAAVGTVPRLVERAREIVDAQRARGMDTEGGVVSRARGVLPLSGPLVLSALTEVELRTMVLEARAFAAPGKRTVLRAQPDSAPQRFMRWGLTVLTLAALVAGLTGYLAWLP